MTDTHTHIYIPDAYGEEDGGPAGAAQRALDAGVGMMIFPCVDLNSLEPIEELHRQFPNNTKIALGLHPTEVKDDFKAVLDKMEALLPGDFTAIGEVGIDLYHDSSRCEEQREAFARQLGWAKKHGLPVLIHCRDGLEDTLDIIKQTGSQNLRLVFHSFTGATEDVKKIREVCDPWFGINGVVTFKNAPALREALHEIGIDKIVLETDAPWLSPVPHRGKRNESARIPHILKTVADTINIEEKEAERITDQNAKNLIN